MIYYDYDNDIYTAYPLSRFLLFSCCFALHYLYIFFFFAMLFFFFFFVGILC
jgi:hypothetical protein